ncbi:MAG TPA: hypothetical protein VF898_04540 [Chloroflexota bacterium]
MEAEEWQSKARETAERLGRLVEDLEARYWPVPVDISFRAFWHDFAALQESIATSTPITSEGKQELQKSAADLSRRLRNEQRARKAEAKHVHAELLERIQLVNEEIAHASSVLDVQQARADLGAIRGRLSDASGLNREQRSELWNVWQTCNQESWNILNDLWLRNEEALGAFLDEAQKSLEGDNVRGAREHIRAFHAAAISCECSHAAMRRLRSRATALWRDADSAARRKHETYVSQASARLGRWKALLARQDRARSELEDELRTLERRADEARTDVAAALFRGQLAERQRFHSHLQQECVELRKKIESVELSLVNR